MPKDHVEPPPLDEDQLNSRLKDAQSKFKDSIVAYLPSREKWQGDKELISALYDKIRSESGVDSASSSNSQPTAKLSNYHRSKLKTSYNNGIKDVASQTQYLRSCLDQLHEIRRLKEEKRRLLLKKQLQSVVSSGISATGSSASLANEAQHKAIHRSQTSPSLISTVARNEGGGGFGLRRGALMMLLQRAAAALPLWIGDDASLGDEDEPGDDAPPLCGAVPAASDHVCQPGDMVAVRAKVQDGDENWILAEVKKYDQSINKYEVEDIDEEEKERYVISKKKLIPLPRYRAHPQLNPTALFDVNAVVWALYPQTTCFYKGVIERRPAGPNDPYLIAFEDSSYPTGYSLPLGVPQRYVIAQ